MKKIIVLTFTFLLCFGCSPKIPTTREVITHLFDFRKYSEAGFFISRTPYIGLFDPIGEMVVYVIPARNIEAEINEFEIGVLFGQPRTGQESITVLAIENITREELLYIFVNEAKALGADGIVDILIGNETRIIRTVPGTIWRRETVVFYILSGFAIKRK